LINPKKKFSKALFSLANQTHFQSKGINFIVNSSLLNLLLFELDKIIDLVSDMVE
jgi:hypothetical protein